MRPMSPGRCPGLPWVAPLGLGRQLGTPRCRPGALTRRSKGSSQAPDSCAEGATDESPGWNPGDLSHNILCALKGHTGQGAWGHRSPRWGEVSWGGMTQGSAPLHPGLSPCAALRRGQAQDACPRDLATGIWRLATPPEGRVPSPGATPAPHHTPANRPVESPNRSSFDTPMRSARLRNRFVVGLDPCFTYRPGFSVPPPAPARTMGRFECV
jgi:hypothetical protein